MLRFRLFGLSMKSFFVTETQGHNYQKTHFHFAVHVSVGVPDFHIVININTFLLLELMKTVS